MPLPLILGLGAAAAGTIGIGTGIHGTVKMKDANDTMKIAEKLHKEAISHFEKQNKLTTADMDALGKAELEILHSLDAFTTIFEKIHNRPEFKEYQKHNITLPKFDPQEIKNVSVGAGVLLGGIGGAAMGTAGGFAAAGATTSAVMALGTASTGTAIASLSGAAATNAALAALGGGAIAAGGGGIALGTTMLSAATLGAGILVGGIIFDIVGGSLSDKAEQALEQAKKELDEVNKICSYLSELSKTAKTYLASIRQVHEIYQKQFNILSYTVNTLHKRNWNDFSQEEQLVTENTVLLVGLLYNMGKVKLVLQSENKSDINKVNSQDVQRTMDDTKSILTEKGLLVKHDIHLSQSKVKEILHSKLPDDEYRRWIDPLTIETTENSVRIIASSESAAKCVKNNYWLFIESAVSECLNRKVNICYEVKRT